MRPPSLIPASSTVTIPIIAATLAESLVINSPGSTIRLIGGYNGDFSSGWGVTIITGSLTITSGTLIVENLIIQ